MSAYTQKSQVTADTPRRTGSATAVDINVARQKQRPTRETKNTALLRNIPVLTDLIRES